MPYRTPGQPAGSDQRVSAYQRANDLLDQALAYLPEVKRRQHDVTYHRDRLREQLALHFANEMRSTAE